MQRGIGRSVRLFREFLVEQTEPERFYGALARDSVELLQEWTALERRTVLDVGAGPAEFAQAFRAAGARYVPLDHDPSVASVHDRGVVASAAALPFADGSVDVCLSSNVAEHVPRPWQLGAEMLRVTRPGGLAILSYTVWLGPFGGHEMGLTHYLGGARAAARYTRKHGHPPKNNYGSSLFAVSAADGLNWAASTGALVAAFPRYHPRWAWWLTSTPGIREFLVSNLVLVLRPPNSAK